jgi:hypothetical protein
VDVREWASSREWHKLQLAGHLGGEEGVAWLDQRLDWLHAGWLARRINTNGDSKLWSQKRLKLINQVSFLPHASFLYRHGFSGSLWALSPASMARSLHAHASLRVRVRSACSVRSASERTMDRMCAWHKKRLRST